MDHGELTAKGAPSLESVHEMKLEALLHDLLKREGRLRGGPDAGGQLQDGGPEHRFGAVVGAPAGGPHDPGCSNRVNPAPTNRRTAGPLRGPSRR